LGFFDLSRRYEGLDVKDDPLVAIAAMIHASGRALSRALVRSAKPSPTSLGSREYRDCHRPATTVAARYRAYLSRYCWTPRTLSRIRTSGSVSQWFQTASRSQKSIMLHSTPI
jgi:hypothetical protein